MKYKVVFTHKFTECPLSPWHQAGAQDKVLPSRNSSVGVGEGINAPLIERRNPGDLPRDAGGPSAFQIYWFMVLQMSIVTGNEASIF